MTGIKFQGRGRNTVIPEVTESATQPEQSRRDVNGRAANYTNRSDPNANIATIRQYLENLNTLFRFERTPQGVDYWTNVRRELRDLVVTFERHVALNVSNSPTGSEALNPTPLISPPPPFAGFWLSNEVIGQPEDRQVLEDRTYIEALHRVRAQMNLDGVAPE